MKGVNRVFLIGHLGKDPEVMHTKSGFTVAKFSLATTEKRKVGDSWEDATEWHRITTFGKLAEVCGQYLTKGSPVYLEGRIQYGKYTDKSGNERYTTDIICNQMNMLGGKDERTPYDPTGGKANRHIDEADPSEDESLPF